MGVFVTVLIVSVSMCVKFQCASALVPENDKDWGCTPTSPDVLGPYYFPDAPYRRHICQRDPNAKKIVHLLVQGRVMDENCNGLSGANVEVWQADHQGHYLFREKCRGSFPTGKGGHYAMLTLHPGKYSTDPDGVNFRPAHIHFRVEKAGYDVLVTQMYFRGDPSLGQNDSCTRCSSAHEDLIVDPEEICADDTKEYCFNLVNFDLVLRKGKGVDVVADVDDSPVELEDTVLRGK